MFISGGGNYEVGKQDFTIFCFCDVNTQCYWWQSIAWHLGVIMLFSFSRAMVAQCFRPATGAYAVPGDSSFFFAA